MTIPPRRRLLIAYILCLLLALVAIHLYWPYLLAGRLLWHSPVDPTAGGVVRVYALEPATAPGPQQLEIYWRPWGAWRWNRHTTTIPTDAVRTGFTLDGRILHVSYEQPRGALGDTAVLLPPRR